jgi:ubiquinone/menaquinone biosynthesis C-methylase UbiE
MSNEVHGAGSETPEGHSHHHKGKSSERFLNKEVILQTLNIQPGQTILDAGCGNGYMAKIFAEKVTPSGKVYALDPDADSIEVLKKETHGSNIEAFVGDITKPTQIKPSSLDLFYIAAVIHGFSRQKMQDLLAEAQRLLKPKSVLAIVEIDKKETPIGPPLALRYSPEELRELVPWAPLQTVRAGEHFYLLLFQKNDQPAS